MDKVLMRGFELMVSNDPDSTEQLRELLYDSLVQKYGAGVKPPPLPEDCYPGATSSGLLLDSSDSQSPYQSPLPLHLSDDSSQASADIDDNSSMNFTELSCIICGLFSVGACNQLMECNSCQNLYHQDCHNPPIKVVARSHWECSDCGASKQSQLKSSSEEKFIHGDRESVSTKLDHKSLHKPSSSLNLIHKSSSKVSSNHSSSSSSHSSHSHRSHHSHNSNRHGSSSKRHSSSSHKSSSHHSSHKSGSSRELKHSD